MQPVFENPTNPDEIPMAKGQHSSDSEMAASVQEVPTISWSNYTG